MPACQGVIVGLADTVDRHYHPKPSPASQRTGGGSGQHWPPAALTARWGPLRFQSGKSAVLFSAPGTGWSSPYPWWCQQLVRPATTRSYANQTHQQRQPSQPENVASAAARRRKIFLFKQSRRPRQHYFPYSSLLRLFLQGSLSSHRSVCTFSSTICLIRVRTVHLVQRILSKVFFTAKSARRKSSC